MDLGRLGEGQVWCSEQEHYDPNMTSQNQLDTSVPGSPHQGAAAETERDRLLVAAQVFLTGLTTYVAIAIWSTTAAGYTEGLQIIGFAVFSTPLTILAFLAGLPLRIVPRARRWWFRHAGWFFALFGVAAGGLLLSYVVGEAGPVRYAQSGWPVSDGYVPDARLFVPSLAVLAFATMHLRLPPRRKPKAA
ncbi:MULTISPECIES: hypothetical protein [Microbacterium]|jgi:hypothetical protein|uniref:hypothetical protein n=1 Tax=Microbacterium TaxID=33882 RepID=UPI000D0191EE|nr:MULTISPECIES: hypothetical protein [Microbacterium]AVL97779.1 hypothetical protein C6C15_12080 [Microbacterium sp. str. 'China']MCK2032339.1 hypothetical protein [Microbacterium sp. KSW4-4]